MKISAVILSAVAILGVSTLAQAQMSMSEPDVAAFAYRSIHIRDGQVENDVRRAA